jgi:flagellar hook assembly protein FlgD
MQKYLDFFNIKRNSVGIDENQSVTQNEKFSVYPNPASEKVYLTFKSDKSPAAKVSVFNINGSLITELKTTSDGISGMHYTEWNLCNQSGQRVPPGLYFCRILTRNEFKPGKILVK